MYGEGKNLRYFIGLGVAIVLLIFVIVLIIHHGGNSKSKVPDTKKTLVSYASQENVNVTETVIGPINAAQNHNQVEIIVNNSATTINLIKGYNGMVTDSKNYPMTTASFTEFLSALDKAKYTSGDSSDSLKDDKGYCPFGNRYIFEISQGANQLQRFWATSCGGTKTYKGNLNATRALFQAQVPNFNDLTNNDDFSYSIF